MAKLKLKYKPGLYIIYKEFESVHIAKTAKGTDIVYGSKIVDDLIDITHETVWVKGRIHDVAVWIPEKNVIAVGSNLKTLEILYGKNK